MNEEQETQEIITQTSTQNEPINNAEQPTQKEFPKTDDNSKNTKKIAYVQSFAGLICLVLLLSLFFTIANEENWYKMTSSCGHNIWIAFFLFGTPLFAAAIAFEASALSRHRNPLSICSLIITIISAVALLIIYTNMNSTPGGC